MRYNFILYNLVLFICLYGGRIMEINYEYFRIFYAVAVNSNISRASQQLHLSQPAVSNGIKAFESLLGFPVFERLPRGVRLTANGTYLFNLIAPAIQALMNAELKAEALKKEKRTLNISCNNSSTEALLLPIVSGYEAEHSNVKAELFEIPMYLIGTSIFSDSLECSVAIRPSIFELSGVDFSSIRRGNNTGDPNVSRYSAGFYRSMVIAGASFRSFSESTHMLKDFSDIPLILITKKNFIRNMEYDTDPVIGYYARTAEQTPSQFGKNIYTSDYEASLDMARKNLGIAIVLERLGHQAIKETPDQLFELKVYDPLIRYEMIVDYYSGNDRAPIKPEFVDYLISNIEPDEKI